MLIAGQPAIQRPLRLIDHAGVRVAHGECYGAGVPYPVQQAKAQGLPGRRLPAVHRHDLLARLQARDIRDGAGFHLADHGRVAGFTGHEQSPVGHDGEQEIGQRTGADHRDALAHRFAVEGPVQFLRGDLPLALVEHLDVTAQGNG